MSVKKGRVEEKRGFGHPDYFHPSLCCVCTGLALHTVAAGGIHHVPEPGIPGTSGLFPSVDDALEVSSLEGSTSDESTVHVGFCKDFLGIAGLAATTIED